MWPFKRKADPVLAPAFTGNCMVRQHTGDNAWVGPCWHSTYNGICPTHGNVAVYLDDLARWPNDFELAGKEHW